MNFVESTIIVVKASIDILSICIISEYLSIQSYHFVEVFVKYSGQNDPEKIKLK